MEMFQAFLSGSSPPCRDLEMETIDIYNNKSTESHFVTLIDIQNMDPCIFSDKKNPETGQQCKETFANLKSNPAYYSYYKIPDDPWVKVYFVAIAILCIYIIYRIMVKFNMVPKD
jgi:hypothetical protein